MISDRDQDFCTCGHIRAEHELDGRCAERVRNDVPDQQSGAHYDPCPCTAFVPRSETAMNGEKDG